MLSLIDPETLHHLVVAGLGAMERAAPALDLVGRHYQRSYPELRSRHWNLEFDNPVGLAAGWDKSAQVPKALAAFGFGFLELGTVTPAPEKGHPRPRIFKSPRGQWILNRIGFANDGAEAVRGRLRSLPHLGCVVGVSLGKNLDTPRERLAQEVGAMMEKLYPYASFFSINISSPNTPGGYLMAEESFLRPLLHQVMAQNRHVASQLGRVPKPLFVKMAPVADASQIAKLAEIMMEESIDGVIATNTLPTPRGGLSGRPLRETALKMTALLYRHTKGALPIIGVGGILSGEDAWQRITAGAGLIQILSGFVLKGPGLVTEILDHLSLRLRESGLKNISESCGIHAQQHC